MNISVKNVLNHNYASRFWLIFGILSPIFGVCVLLSVLDVLPRFPLTEDMTVLTGVIIMFVCIGIMLVGIFSIKSTIANLNNIISNGKMINAIITDRTVLKHQLLIEYEFTYDGQTCKAGHTIAKKWDSRSTYAKGNDLKIYAFKDSDGKILTAPDIY